MFTWLYNKIKGMVCTAEPAINNDEIVFNNINPNNNINNQNNNQNNLNNNINTNNQNNLNNQSLQRTNQISRQTVDTNRAVERRQLIEKLKNINFSEQNAEKLIDEVSKLNILMKEADCCTANTYNDPQKVVSMCTEIRDTHNRILNLIEESATLNSVRQGRQGIQTYYRQALEIAIFSEMNNLRQNPLSGSKNKYAGVLFKNYLEAKYPPIMPTIFETIKELAESDAITVDIGNSIRTKFTKLKWQIVKSINPELSEQKSIQMECVNSVVENSSEEQKIDTSPKFEILESQYVTYPQKTQNKTGQSNKNLKEPYAGLPVLDSEYFTME